jgi:hypothetical protein
VKVWCKKNGGFVVRWENIFFGTPCHAVTHFSFFCFFLRKIARYISCGLAGKVADIPAACRKSIAEMNKVSTKKKPKSKKK